MYKVLFLCSFLTATLIAQNSHTFLPGTTDVPLMNEMEVVDDSLSVVEDDEGKITHVEVICNVPSPYVKQFYEKALPELGWKVDRGNSLRCHREKEFLEINFQTDQNKTVIVFDLMPKEKDE